MLLSASSIPQREVQKPIHSPHPLLQREARLTLRVISGFEDAWSVTGYAIPAKFQKMGFSGQSWNWKLDTRVERTISGGCDIE